MEPSLFFALVLVVVGIPAVWNLAYQEQDATLRRACLHRARRFSNGAFERLVLDEAGGWLEQTLA